MVEEKERPDVYEGIGTAEDAMVTVSEAAECHDHKIELSFKEEDIEKVFYCRWSNAQEYADTDSETVFRLKDGRYVHAEEWGDSSGHG